MVWHERREAVVDVAKVRDWSLAHSWVPARLQCKVLSWTVKAAGGRIGEAGPPAS